MPTVKCSNEDCNNTYHVKPYAIKDGKKTYCSMECSWIGRDKNSVPMDCAYCGKPFISKKYNLKGHNGKCCSFICGKRYTSDQTKRNPEERFWEKVKKGEPNECWEFQGAKNPDGYGIFYIDKQHIRSGGAHRAAWIFSNKTEIPQGLKVLHSCDNPPCCNPAHLSIGTQAENVYDMVAKKRHRCPEGVDHAHAKVNEEIVLILRKEYNGKRGNVGNMSSLARRFNITVQNVAAIVKRETWKHVK
jgi:hypothetical protein